GVAVALRAVPHQGLVHRAPAGAPRTGREVSAGEHRDRRSPGGVRVGLPQGQLNPGARSSPDPGGGLAPRLRLRPSIELLEAADGDIYLVRPGDADLVVRAPDALDRLVLRALARTA